MGQTQSNHHVSEIIKHDHPVCQYLNELRMGLLPKLTNQCKYQTIDRNNSTFFERKNMSLMENQLPDELIAIILSYLDNREIVKLTRLNRNFRNYWVRRAIVVLRVERFENVNYGPYMWIIPRINIVSDESKEKHANDSMVDSFLHFNSHFLPFLNSNIKVGLNPGSVVKFLVMGPKGCGKTKMALKLVNPNIPFTPYYSPTISCDVHTIRYTILGKSCSVQMWDASGDDLFKSAVSSQFINTHIFLYCFDLSSRESFEKLRKEFIPYFQNIRTKGVSIKNWLSVGDGSECFFIVGLKSDLERQVSREMIEELMRELTPYDDELSHDIGIPLHRLRTNYFELSSLKDSNSQLLLPLQFGLLLQRKRFEGY